MPRRRRGFTLVELLVVISIIGVLMSMLVPAVNVARESARKSQCSNNLRQLCLALQSYESALKTLPPGRVGCDCTGPDVSILCKADKGKAYRMPSTSGFLLMLPYLDEATLYQKFRNFPYGSIYPGDGECPDATTKTNWMSYIDGGTNTLLARPTFFACPTDRSGAYTRVYPYKTSFNLGLSNYAFCMGRWGPSTDIPSVLKKEGVEALKYKNDGMFMYKMAYSSKDCTDGGANTIFIGEVRNAGLDGRSMNRWMHGYAWGDSLRSVYSGLAKLGDTGYYAQKDANAGQNANSFSAYSGFGSSHSGGATFGFGDGHVTFVSYMIDTTVYRYMGTRNGMYASGGVESLDATQQQQLDDLARP